MLHSNSETGDAVMRDVQGGDECQMYMMEQGTRRANSEKEKQKRKNRENREKKGNETGQSRNN